MALLSLILLTISFAREADDDIRTEVDSQIERECAPRLQQGLDHYANCISQRGIAAEHTRQQTARQSAARNQPIVAPSIEMNCKPQDALASCQRASQIALEKYNDPNIGANTLSSALGTCRSACNPESFQVLRNFLSGCRGNISQIQETMRSTMSNCGTATAAGTVAASAVSAVASSVPQDVQNMFSQEMSWSDRLNAGAQRVLGYSWNPAAGSTSNAVMIAEGTQLSGGVRYMQVNVAGVQTYAYCSVDNSCHQSYAAAAQKSAPLLLRSGTYGAKPRNNVTPSAGEDEFGVARPVESVKSGFEETVEFVGTQRAEERMGMSGTDAHTGKTEDDQIAEVVPQTEPVEVPEARITEAEMPTPERQDQYQNTTSSIDDSPTVVTPSPQNPVSYEAGNFPSLQRAVNPMISASSGSSSSGYLREVARGGGGGSHQLGNSKPLNFTGSGQVSPGVNRNLDISAQRPHRNNASDGIVSAASSGYGGGFSGGNSFPRGTSVAARSPSGGSPDPQLQIRSDSFYNSGKGSPTGYSRPAARSCVGKNCAQGNRSPRSIKSANCDGNPQCILALTGKIRVPRRARVDDWEESPSPQSRGIASVRSQHVRGGIVRGKTHDIMSMMNGSEVFKLDWDGYLATD